MVVPIPLEIRNGQPPAMLAQKALLYESLGIGKGT